MFWWKTVEGRDSFGDVCRRIILKWVLKEKFVKVQ
jgi:hypothetical protein